jgi:hypothetical protein
MGYKGHKMAKVENKDSRYYIEIDVKTLKVINSDYADKHSIDKGRQTDPKIHRLFLTKGQYNKFVGRKLLAN